MSPLFSGDLCRALVAHLKPYIRKARSTGLELGSGTYGSVIELVSAGEVVAGKVFKNILGAHMQAVLDKLLWRNDCDDANPPPKYCGEPRCVFSSGKSLASASDGTTDEQSTCLPH